MEDLTRHGTGHDGDREPPPADAWFSLLYDELRRVADARLRRERKDHTLSATALVHEAYLKLSPRDVEWGDSQKFYAAASRAMREILCDHARARASHKRGGNASRLTLAESRILSLESGAPPWDLLDLEEALSGLAEIDPRKAQGAELRFFTGLDHGEIAAIQEVSLRTVEADWYLSREWLAKRLLGGEQE